MHFCGLYIQNQHFVRVNLYENWYLIPSIRLWWITGSHRNTRVTPTYRMAMLEAVTDPSCINPPEARCNLCSLSFAPTWTYLMPGNFWIAPCTYINKLLSPLQFKLKMQNLRKSCLRWKIQGLLDENLWKRLPWSQLKGNWWSGTSSGTGHYFCTCIGSHKSHVIHGT